MKRQTIYVLSETFSIWILVGILSITPAHHRDFETFKNSVWRKAKLHCKHFALNLLKHAMSLQNGHYKLFCKTSFGWVLMKCANTSKEKLITWQRVLYLVIKMNKSFILTGLDKDK